MREMRCVSIVSFDRSFPFSISKFPNDLVSPDALFNMRFQEGKTPLDYARRKGMPEDKLLAARGRKESSEVTLDN